MKQLKLLTVCIALSGLVIGCNNETAADKTEAVVEVEQPAKVDLASVKTDIQNLETAWAAADNARDTNAIAAFYADDAVSLRNNNSMIQGKEAIRKDIGEGLAKRAKGATVSYDVVEVFGEGNYITEVGKSTTKDASGKVINTGKYMAIWEKRDGKYVCIRDIYNDDAKPK
ncbi:SgcJ/EcaC family oxidoreductase [Flavihumibacter sp. ZG627]|uniref:YybH family protein n=1 Tax=Flavihumibacter sp. ZG627 TaxID=1463156 RepID=UPI00057FCF4B|nr:SgcJ/EcaC family oxidoreductase [Flavihumibacter sp. ZG627]KIC90293.1 hypothetical protein HY58_09975 [Flavihumibacter sp. ZG627]